MSGTEEQTRPLPTGTILSVEIAATLAVLGTGAVLVGRGVSGAMALLLLGLLIAAAAPVTLGALWDNPGTSKGTKYLAAMMAIMWPVMILTGVVHGHFRYNAQAYWGHLPAYGLAMLLFCLARWMSGRSRRSVSG